MNVLERLKLELNNKPYFTDDEFTIFLEEQGFWEPDFSEYAKKKDQLPLQKTVLAIFEALANDTSNMIKTQTEFLTTSDASTWLNKRIADTKKKIKQLEYEADEESSSFSLMYTRR